MVLEMAASMKGATAATISTWEMADMLCADTKASGRASALPPMLR